MNYEGRAYRTPMGWSWAIRKGLHDIVRGGSYQLEDAARGEMNFELNILESAAAMHDSDDRESPVYICPTCGWQWPQRTEGP